MSKNKITYGLEKLHIAFLSEDSTPETPEWETPVHIPGAINFTSSPEGDESSFYADNKVYYIYNNNNGYTGDIEVALISDEILAEMLGMTVDDNGMIAESPNDKPKEFALLAQIKGDERDRRFVYYRCKAGRPEQENSTKEEEMTPDTLTAPLTMLPIESGDDMWTKGVIELSDTNTEIYDAWFDAVTLPEITPEA